MLKKLLLLIATLCATATFAAVDVNTATEADLDGIKGIGPGLSGRILEERKSAPFKDWSDFIGRVGGVGNKSAVNFSREGLTVNGKKYSAAAAAKAQAKSQASHSAHSKKTAGTAHERKQSQTPVVPPEAAGAPAAAASASKN
ncbi:helix-hairpin-helix domain-containing protein [Acidovorax sp. sic0104]|uniref:ComEA family DNA-binding protein n=1 Tax=Acidovorax sp. sic0104 TaxID=2854784 RepID=UPI001C4973CD|nr:helix-hairpin-helix domain-containing protein [Acidovorax sp. sic0104]MBV7540687.1 helix-hairpin-helix domain-containing protein [Acidovorax sp. sic0104]